MDTAPPKRMRPAGDAESAVQNFKSTLSSVWVPQTWTFQPWYSSTEQVVDCKKLPDDVTGVPGFAKTGEGKYQYSFTHPETKKRTRPVAYRMSFLLHPEFDNESWTVSHLCHNNWCMNWEHHVLEPLAVNKARNGCPGGPSCRHRTKCLVPGPYHDA